MSPFTTLAGRVLVGGFEGTSLPASIARSLGAGELAGVIVFKRNLPTLEATAAIARAAHDAVPAVSPPPLVAIDQEGGRVVRLPPPAAALPPLRVLGRIGDAELARRAGHAVGAQLAALGVNLDFAPVLDVDSNPANPIIGDRSLSADPAEVARLGLAFAQGLADGGVLGCGKHFPGHGDTDLDSHLALPFVRHDRERLERIELLPFRAAAAAGLESLMSAHVVMEALEPEVPATLSHRIITTLLRDELGYRGVIFSDDLEMKAVADRYEVEVSAVRAIEAGCDALLVCREESWLGRARVALAARAAGDAGFRARLEQAAGRVDALRALAAQRARDARPAAADVAAVASEILARGASA